MSDLTSKLTKVHLASDVYCACIQHALTTEKQEIMGLLIGDVDEVTNVSHISACVILHRSDKQPDRVEISPEQLCRASMHAEQLGIKLKTPMRVLGWYHSHPHITVWPSHVDIRTQDSYQMMDPMFVGLIFSVYQNDGQSRSNRIQVTCFQSVGVPPNLERREVPLIIKKAPFHNNNLEGIINLPRILVQEEIESRTIEETENDNILSRLYNDASKTISLVKIGCKVTRPLCDDLEARIKAARLRIKELKALQKRLKVNNN